MNGRELFEIYAQERAYGTQRNKYWEFLGGKERDFWVRFAARLEQPVVHALFDPYEVDPSRYSKAAVLDESPGALGREQVPQDDYPLSPKRSRIMRFLSRERLS